MTSDLDLSPEAVERLASQFDRCASIVDSVELPGAKIPFINTAANLRALAAENARLRAERDAAWQAGAVAMREAAASAAVNVHNVRIIGCRMGSDWINGHRIGSYDAADAIRALPLPGLSQAKAAE